VSPRDVFIGVPAARSGREANLFASPFSGSFQFPHSKWQLENLRGPGSLWSVRSGLTWSKQNWECSAFVSVNWVA